MPSEVVLGAVYVALKALMAGYAPLTGLLAVKPIGVAPAIYDDGAVPQAALMPYLTIGAGTQVRDHTMGEAGAGRYGWNCTLQIKATGQMAEAAGLNIVSQVAAVLYDGRELSLAGYGYAWAEDLSVQPTQLTVLAGVTTREWPVILRVKAYD